MKFKSCILKKVISGVLAFSMIMPLIPVGTIAAGENEDLYASISTEISGGMISNDKTSDVSVVFSGDNASPNYNADKAKWEFLLKVTAPVSADTEKASYQSSDDDEVWSEKMSYNQNKTVESENSPVIGDSSNVAANNSRAYGEGKEYLNLSFLAAPDDFIAGKADDKDFLERYWQFDWDGDGNYEQKLTVKVSVNEIKLIKDGEPVYPIPDTQLGTVKTDFDLDIDSSDKYSIKLVGKNIIKLEKENSRITADVIAPESVSDNACVQVMGKDGVWGDSIKVKEKDNTLLLSLVLSEDVLKENSGKDISTIYRYDWNGDGYFDQVFFISVKADSIILLDKGVQIYPVPGEVGGSDDITIEGNKSGNVVITQKNNIEITPTSEQVNNETVYSYKKNISVTSPAYYNGETVKYQIFVNNSLKETKEVTGVSVLSLTAVFDKNSISKDNEFVWLIDWNSDGEYEQTVTYKVAKNLVALKKLQQAPLVFEYPFPDDICYGDTFANPVKSGGSVSGAIEYSSDNEAVAKVDKDGKLIIYKASEAPITITATLKGNDYFEDVTEAYKIKINLAKADSFAFSKSDSVYTVTYGDNFQNIATVSGVEDGGTITYSSSAADVADVDKEGNIKTYRAGKTTIYAVYSYEGRYETETVSYELIVEKADQEITISNSLQDNKAVITYGDKFKVDATAKTEIKYSINEEDTNIAEIDDKGNVIVHKAGSVTVYLSTDGNECYNSAEISFVLVINKANQVLSIEKENPVIKYNDNENKFINPSSSENVTGTEKDITVTYSLSEAYDIYGLEAEPQSVIGNISEDGELTVINTGKVKVTVTYSGNDRYLQESISYTLTVNRSEQAISFPEKQYSIYTGTELTEPVLNISDKHGTGEITYSVESDANNIIESVNAQTGELTFTNKNGTATIKAVKAQCEKYNEATATYLISVNPYVISGNAYTITGEQKDTDSGWFTGDVTVKPSGEADKISVSKDKSAIWAENLTLDTEGEHSISFYINTENGISDKYTETIKIDKQSPVISIVEQEPSIWDIITSLIWNNEKAVYTLDYSDNMSGIKSVSYYVLNITPDTAIPENDEELEKLAWVDYNEKIEFETKKSADFILLARAIDIAGNISYAAPDRVLNDRINPDINVTLPDTINGYYTSDVLVSFKVTDSSPSSGIKKVTYSVTNNGTVTQSGDLFNAEYDEEQGPDISSLVLEKDLSFTVDSVKNNSDYVKITITAEDFYGNTGIYENDIKIIASKPSVSITFSDTEPVNTLDEFRYYNTPITAEIKVTGRSSLFKAENVVTNFKSEVLDGKETAKNYTASEWEHIYDSNGNTDNDIHILQITLNGNARYSEFNVSYYDTVNEIITEFAGDKIVVDNDRPSGTVKVDDNEWTLLLNTITFGLWKNTAYNVSVDAVDKVSPIKSIEYFLTDDINAKSEDDLISDNSIKWIPYVMPFVVDANQRFTVYMRITDYAENIEFISSNGHILENYKPDDITVSLPEANKYGYYNSDITAEINVSDSMYVSSGIKSIEYWVESYGKETQRNELFNFSYTNTSTDVIAAKGNLVIIDYATGEKVVTEEKNIELTHDKLVFDWKGNIVIDADKNNSDNVVIYVKVTDNANNISVYNSDIIKIGATKPTVTLSYDNNKANIYDGRGYFDDNRTAELVFNVRDDIFNKQEALDIIKLSANGVEADINDYCEWVETDEANKAVLRLSFTEDANYILTISEYTDMASNTCEINSEGCTTPYIFTVDKNNPTGSIVFEKNIWDDVLRTLTFGYWRNRGITITAVSDDATSPVITEYYKTDRTTLMSLDELRKIDDKDWNTYSEITVSDDERVVIYLRVTDYAGNRIFVHSDGIIVDKVKSEIEFSVMTEPSGVHKTANEDIPVYNKDVNVRIAVNDPDVYSGISKVEYWVTSEGKETQRETLYSMEIEHPEYHEIISSLEKTVTIKSLLNNSCDVKLYVKATDNAGNVITKSISLDIDITPPEIQITYDNNNPYRSYNESGYFSGARTATIVITERTAHFDKAAALKGIVITAYDAKGNAVAENTSSLISGWTTTEGDTTNAAKHSVTVDFSRDANYTLAVAYIDTAGNKAYAADTVDSVSPYKFTVDKTAPTGTVKIGELGVWDRLLSIITFGLWSRTSVDVTATYDDATSPIESISYYKTNETTIKTLEEISKLSWTQFAPFTISPDDQAVIYLRIVDMAGNTTYLCSNGVIVDETHPLFAGDAPEISFKLPQTTNGFYTDNVTVGIEVYDPMREETDDAYSGLKEISYEVLSLGNVTHEREVLYHFDRDNPTQGQLLQRWIGNIVIDAAENNSNDVEIRVYAVDNAGNEYIGEVGNYASENIKIDFTDPQITVSYDNNDGVTAFDEGIYFKDNRTATITVTERNFDPERVTINITNAHGVIPTLSEWTTIQGVQANGDDTTHVARVVFGADGDYTFDISAKDISERECTSNEVSYGNSLAPREFTVDKTAPTVVVIYDNSSAENGNYFKEQRTAQIIVTEHNFDINGAVIDIAATDNGTAIKTPDISGWTSNGDEYTAVITYSADARYVFNFDYTDKAGNKIDAFQQQEFYIDKTAPSLQIEGVENKKSYNGDITPIITCTDTNFDASRLVITLSGANRKNVEVTGILNDIVNGQTFTFDEFKHEKEIDDIYTLTVTATDKAGNTYSQTIEYSLNRFGSTYEMDEFTENLVNSYTNNAEDVVISEINATPLKNIMITLFKNDKTIELVEGTDFRIDIEGSEGTWYKYIYTIFAKNFKDDGIYRIVIHSEDAAGNVSENILETKDKEISFGIDNTPPNIIVTNLESNMTYAVDMIEVELTVKDNLRLNEVLIVLDGNVIKTVNGDELKEAINNGGIIRFTIDGSSTYAHNLMVYASDEAGNGIKIGDDEPENAVAISDFYVTTNLWVRFFNNKILFYGSIIGVVVLVGLTVFIIVLKKKKKEEKSQ